MDTVRTQIAGPQDSPFPFSIQARVQNGFESF